MGVYIKDMEVPTSCAVCGWSSYVGNGRAMCLKTSMTEKTDIMSNRRPDWCPLVEVKEFHSDLIEREEAIKAAQRADDDRVSLSDSHIMSDAFEREIKDIETIIEAEGSKEEE